MTSKNKKRLGRERASRKLPEGDTYLGKDVSGVVKGDKRRVANEIDDNEFEEGAEVAIVDDPSEWMKNMGLELMESSEKQSKKTTKKWEDVAEKAYTWLKEDEVGQSVTSLVELRSYIGITSYIWSSQAEKSEKFANYTELIRELIAARIHNGAIRNKFNPVFGIFSLKSQYSEEFNDDQNVNHSLKRVDVIQITEGDRDAVQKSIEENKKRITDGKKN